jgi:hypothetical protein
MAIIGKAIAAPFADPTKPYVEEAPEISLQSNLFSVGKELTKLANARWQVGFLKIYPNKSQKNWAMIEGRRVGVGSEVFGGRVVALSKKRLELQQSHKRRSLILLECDSQAGNSCNSMYYIVSPSTIY